MTLRTSLPILAPLLLAAGLLAPAHDARAGNVANAVLTCYVDTNAQNIPRPNLCRGVWTPWGGGNPTSAVFQVTGLTPGSYVYTWIDLETGGVLPCTGVQCVVSIATDTAGDGQRRLSVTITDVGTGLQKTVTANARYIDGYH